VTGCGSDPPRTALQQRGAPKPVPGSTEAEIGKHPKTYDLAGQNKVIVMTISDLYELIAAGATSERRDVGQ
jgi:hypothetical protein